MKTVIYKNIVCDEAVCGGRPTIEGTRITVNTILSFLLAGDSEGDILINYPSITKQDIQTVKEYSTQKFDPQFFIHPLEAS